MKKIFTKIFIGLCFLAACYTNTEVTDLNSEDSSIASRLAVESSITITSPAQNSTVSGVVTINFTLQGLNDLHQLDFFVDGQLFGGCGGDYVCSSFSWPTTTATDGQHVLTIATGYYSPQITSNPVTVFVNNNFKCLEFTSSTAEHVLKKRAYRCGLYSMYACAIGSGDKLGWISYLSKVTVAQTKENYYKAGFCPK